MARAAMRRLTVAAALATLLAGGVAGVSRPPSEGVALAAVETEGVGPDLNRALPAFGGSAPVELPQTGNPLWGIPISKLSATRDRPLFSVSRRPRTPPAAPAAPEPAAVVAPPPPPETPPFTLVGTIIGDDSQFAIFYDQSSGTASGVRLGGSASGWTLRAVDPHSATVEGSGRVVTLDLPEPSAEGNPVSAENSSVSGQETPVTRASGTPARGRFMHQK